MCLGVPGRITEIWTAADTQLPMARVDFGGVAKEICLALEPAAQVDDFVLVHVGFAISRIDADEARRTLQLLSQMGELDDLEASALSDGPYCDPLPDGIATTAASCSTAGQQQVSRDACLD